MTRLRHPLLIPPFTNDTLRRAVQDYLAGGASKRRIREKYGEINNWDVSKVTNMRWMFEDATSFNQPLNKWNVSKVTYMNGMFAGASSFNQPLINWNVSKVIVVEGLYNNYISRRWNFFRISKQEMWSIIHSKIHNGVN